MMYECVLYCADIMNTCICIIHGHRPLCRGDYTINQLYLSHTSKDAGTGTCRRHGDRRHRQYKKRRIGRIGRHDLCCQKGGDKEESLPAASASCVPGYMPCPYPLC